MKSSSSREPAPAQPGRTSVGQAQLRQATDVAGDRWVLLTLAALADGPRRFGDLSGDVVGIAPNVLTDRLRRMERHGIVVASLYSQRPRRYVYELTESGRELAVILPALTNWASRHEGGDTSQHPVCGTPLETRLWCPTCEVAVSPDDVTHQGTSHGNVDGRTDGDRGGDTELRWL